MQYYRKYLKDRGFVVSLVGGVLFLILSFIVQGYASMYATSVSSSPVTDIILSNTRVYDVDAIFVYGSVILFFFIIFLAARRINYTPFIAKSLGVFTLIRSFFVSLTHISPFPNHIIVTSTFFDSRYFSGIFTGNDLFFSGHTGLPFLMALMFWDHKPLRYIFLGFSLMFAVVVLLGHLHYSIDVLAAYFITYAIFDLVKFLFKKDWQVFLNK